MASFVTHFFLPHQSNNHRPKALHIDALLVYLVLFIVFRFGLQTTHRMFPDVLGYATDIRVEALLEATNQKRQSQGLSALSLNAQLSDAAAQKAVDMFAKNYWAHTSPEGKTPWDFIIASGYHYSVAGENLAKNFSTSVNVVDAWMTSPTHRENILKSSYRDVGFAVVNGSLNGEETTLVVQTFAASATPQAAIPATKQVEIPEAASQIAQSPVIVPEVESKPASIQTVASAFAAVSKKPVFNIPTVSRDVSYIFVGVMMIVLVLDAFLVSRRRVVRVTGHNIAHVIFFVAITVALSLAERGSLL